ncbi:MAG: hypothetical protein WCS85_05330 [Candidatus Peribacteraceae bacterium]|jgi:hypothetical protein
MKLPMFQHRLVRQLFGGIAGMLVALAMYEGYALASPLLATLLPEASTSPDAEQEQRQQERIDHIVLEVKQMLEK